MWKPEDINALPTPDDRIKAQNAIFILEDALKEARLRVQRLEADLVTRRAWIVPVRYVPLEILSLIFEICAKDDWKSPLGIAAVSRSWRTAVLASPRVWSLLNFGGFKDKETIKLFLERGGQCPLHVCLDYSFPLTLFQNFSPRLQCLSVYMLPQDQSITFSNLKRLTLRIPNRLVPLSLVNMVHFPALRYLVCGGSLFSDFSDISDLASWINNIPPLEGLSLPTATESMWGSIVDRCKSTLVSLKLELRFHEGNIILPPGTSTLPLCKTLAIHHWGLPPDAWLLPLVTPLLKYYTQHQIVRNDRGVEYQVLHTDTGQVVHLRTNRMPPADSAVPNLRVLEISHIPLPLTTFLSEVFSNKDTYPALRRIAYCSEGNNLVIHQNDFERSEILIENLNSHRKHPIVLEIVKTWQDDVPGTIKNFCGKDMPCYDE